jgi:hypothetical protein
MNKLSLDQLIRAETSRALPACPTNLEANVLRRIRLSTPESTETGMLDWLLGLVTQRSLAIGALALTALFSIGASAVLTSSYASATETQSLAANALDFGVFQETHVFNFDH